MNISEFRRAGYQMIDTVADYMDNIKSREPLANVEPGYMRQYIPHTAPERPEEWDDILEDLEPSCTHWNHPNFYAYFPAGNSWPSVLGDILTNTFAGSCSTWDSCPAGTELEMIVCDWVAKFLKIPKFFYSTFSNPTSQGGGSLESSASEAIFLSLIAAREYAVHKLMKRYPRKERAILKDLLVCYCNDQSHSSVEKGAIMAGCTLRLLQPNDDGVITAKTFVDAVRQDMEAGLVPFFLNAILGSTGITVFDDLLQVGPVCSFYDIWLHVDGSYAGSSFSCTELQYLTRGLEHAWSFNTNGNKWMLTNFDCSFFWVKYRHLLVGCMSGYNSALYNTTVHEYRYWGIPSTRRFRAIKIWCVIRNYGIKGIRKYVRNHCTLAKRLENHIRRNSDIFDVIGEARVGLCCFTYKGELEMANTLTQRLLEVLNASRRIHMVPTLFQHKFVIRMAVCFEFATTKDIDYAWKLIKENSDIILQLSQLESEVQNLESSYKDKSRALSFPSLDSVALEKLKRYYSEHGADTAARRTSTIYASRDFGQMTTEEKEEEFEKKADQNREKFRKSIMMITPVDVAQADEKKEDENKKK